MLAFDAEQPKVSPVSPVWSGFWGLSIAASKIRNFQSSHFTLKSDLKLLNTEWLRDIITVVVVRRRDRLG